MVPATGVFWSTVWFTVWSTVWSTVIWYPQWQNSHRWGLLGPILMVPGSRVLGPGSPLIAPQPLYNRDYNLGSVDLGVGGVVLHKIGFGGKVAG